MAEKLANLDLADVLKGKTVLKTEPSTARADRNGRYGRDFISTITMIDYWCLAARRPGAEEVCNQEESGFVAKDEVGTQARGVFLSWATRLSSNARWLPHFSRAHDVPAFGGSIPAYTSSGR